MRDSELKRPPSKYLNVRKGTVSGLSDMGEDLPLTLEIEPPLQFCAAQLLDLYIEIYIHKLTDEW